MFAEPASRSSRSIVNTEYKPIEMPKYTQSTYARELKVKPYEEPVLIAPDNIAKEIFDRGDNKPTTKKKNTTRKNSKKSDDSNSNANSNFDANLAAMSSSDDSDRNVSCTPNYSSRSCASPVESYSSSSYSSSSSDSSSSSSCDSGGGSCGGGD